MTAIAQTVDDAPLRGIKAPQREPGHAVTTARAPCGRIWVAVHTHPNAEHWARANLRRQGFDVYLPMVIVQRRDRVIRSLIHRVEAPLFSRYLFVSLADAEPWTPVTFTPGVHQVLMSGEKPHMVPEAILEAVRAGEALRRTPTPASVVYRPGAAVTLTHGPCQGQDAVVIAVAATTCRVALPMLGAIRELVVPIERLATRDHR